MFSTMGNRFSNATSSKTQTVNSNLLKINDISLNIYLDGFDVAEFLKTSKLIKMYGGIVSIPNAETVVLSAPNYSIGTNYLRFHINWLHDSIERNELQDIGKYILEDGINDEKGKKMEEKRSETDNRALQCVNKAPLIVEPPRLTSELKECKIHIRDIRDKPPQLDRMEFPAIMASTNKMVLEAVKPLNLKIEPHENSKKSSAAFRPKRNRIQKHEWKESFSSRRVLYSKEDDQKILKYLIENSAISKVGRREIWQDMKAAGIIPKRSSTSLKTRFMKHVKKNIRKYVDNADIVAEFEALDNEVK